MHIVDVYLSILVILAVSISEWSAEPQMPLEKRGRLIPTI